MALIYGFGSTLGQIVEWDGVQWTLTDVVEVDFTGATTDTPREPRAPVTAPDGREGEMYWHPIFYWEVDNFDVTKNISGVILLDED